MSILITASPALATTPHPTASRADQVAPHGLTGPAEQAQGRLAQEQGRHTEQTAKAEKRRQAIQNRRRLAARRAARIKRAHRTHSTAASAASGDPLTTIGLSSGAAGATDPSGAPMPAGNLPGWKQVYSDDFTTSVPVGGFSDCTAGGNTLMTAKCSGLPASVASQLWAYPDGWKDTSKNGTYEPSQVLSIHNGMLDYDMHSADGMHMVSAVQPKIPGGVDGNGLHYGAYAVRFKADTNPGYKTAFLLWPDSEVWPHDGEIDFPEGNLDGTMAGNMHHMGATSGADQSSYGTSSTYSGWHTAVIEWTPSLCRFILDGKIIGTTTSLVPNTPMHWVLQAETSLDGGAPANSVTDHIYIDWIAAYSQAS